MSTQDEARTFALSLPEVTQGEHHEMTAYRVRNKIFATVPDPGHLRVMVAEPEVTAAVAEDPAACAPLYWGTRLAGVVVELKAVRTELVYELLTEAWVRKAPPALARSHLGDE